MPNLELKFNVHDNGYRWIDMRKSKMIGHRDPGHSKKFTKAHLKEACLEIVKWMVEYNKSIDNPKPACDKIIIINSILDYASKEVEGCPEWAKKGNVRVDENLLVCIDEKGGCNCSD